MRIEYKYWNSLHQGLHQTADVSITYIMNQFALFTLLKVDSVAIS